MGEEGGTYLAGRHRGTSAQRECARAWGGTGRIGESELGDPHGEEVRRSDGQRRWRGGGGGVEEEGRREGEEEGEVSSQLPDLGHGRERNARTFSLQMVWITSSGGVPSNSVMIENWFTSAGKISQVSFPPPDPAPHSRPPHRRRKKDSRSFPGKSGRPSSISAKMHPALQISTAPHCISCPFSCSSSRQRRNAPATSYFCHVSIISGAR